MGLNSSLNWYAITICFIILQKSCFTTFSLPTNHTNINPRTLDDSLYKYSSNSLSKKRPQTGVLEHISLPSNFSGIKVSIVRLRSTTLWYKGANFTRFDIPPKVIKMKHVKRFAIMYENLGNMSSHYYQLQGYTILTTIIGFAVYNASSFSLNTSPQRLNITFSGEPIKVMFSNDLFNKPQGTNLKNIKCVKFNSINGLAVLSKMTSPNVCLTRTVGLFGLAMPGVSKPKPPPPPPHHLSKGKKEMKFALWKKWLIGFIVGFVALMLLVSGFVLGYKAFGLRKIAYMERKAEKSEALQTRWIGTSKMPSATVTRTQAVLENDLAP